MNPQTHEEAVKEVKDLKSRILKHTPMLNREAKAYELFFDRMVRKINFSFFQAKVLFSLHAELWLTHRQ
jgi:hypothetical protein